LFFLLRRAPSWNSGERFWEKKGLPISEIDSKEETANILPTLIGTQDGDSKWVEKPEIDGKHFSKFEGRLQRQFW